MEVHKMGVPKQQTEMKVRKNGNPLKIGISQQVKI